MMWKVFVALIILCWMFAAVHILLFEEFGDGLRSSEEASPDPTEPLAFEKARQPELRDLF